MSEVIVSRKLVSLIFGVILVASGGRQSLGQAAQNSQPPLVASQSSPVEPTRPQDPWRAKMEEDMAKKANEQRHTALKRDTDRLMKLSTELKAYVDKSNEHLLSLEVVKKADEIEKLAHSVKEKMKGN